MTYQLHRDTSIIFIKIYTIYTDRSIRELEITACVATAATTARNTEQKTSTQTIVSFNARSIDREPCRYVHNDKIDPLRLKIFPNSGLAAFRPTRRGERKVHMAWRISVRPTPAGIVTREAARDGDGTEETGSSSREAGGHSRS